MKTELIAVTPAMAREWIVKAEDNPRPFRPAYGQHWVDLLKRGEWMTTHQGIAFDVRDVLVDGQHRVWAMSQLPDGQSFLVWVTFGVEVEATLAMDIGRMRSAADSLRRPRKEVEVARVLARMAYTSKAVTPQLLEPICERIHDVCEELSGVVPRNQRMWTSAGVRAAAVVSVFKGIDRAYVFHVFRALNYAGDMNSLPRIGASLYQSHMQGKVSSANVLDVFARCMKVFDPAKSHITKQMTSDHAAIIEDARKVITSRIIPANHQPQRRQ